MNGNQHTTLIIMAAGIGSRYGGGIKQLEIVDDYGHIIMDYSIHDAIEAGFDKIVFVIRKDIEAAFKEAIGNRIEKICHRHNVKIGYAYQSLEAIPDGAVLPTVRTKPWGTGQAVLAAKSLVNEPFAVINADDYYGKEAFVKIHDFLVNLDQNQKGQFCMAGFILKNTLSDHGGVTRGVCHVDENNNLVNIVETSNIVKNVSIEADGMEKITAIADGRMIDTDVCVSMNMWGFTPDFMDLLESGFEKFFERDVQRNPEKAEYLLPIYIGEMLQENKISVRVLQTNDRWFGVTYKEDKPLVVENFRKLIDAGIYEKDLFNDKEIAQ